MPKSIAINDLKSIKRLEFVLPSQGVCVLTGVNGSGKTTLMACLERLHSSRAFQNHFRTSVNPKFDSFRESEIVYAKDEISVSYRYTNSRWAPTPKDGSDLLKNFGFDQVVLALVGAVIWRATQDVQVRTRLGSIANMMWITIEGKRYVLNYNHAQQVIELKSDSAKGNIIAVFDDNTSLAEVRRIFSNL